MMKIRRADDRGAADHGWLQTRHTFSFANYYDPRHMGFRHLRVINDDGIAGGRGFGSHPHRDMEIITYVLDGVLEHADSMGNGSLVRPGEVQRMSAGTGVVHSEYNHSATDPLHLLQIWIEPDQYSLMPSYEQRAFPAGERQNTLRLVASRDARQGSVAVHQDVDLYAALLEPGAGVPFERRPDRHLWLQMARGRVRVEDLAPGRAVELAAGDGLATSDSAALAITGIEDAELLLFDLS